MPDPSTERIGFVGLGQMGLPMATRLVEGGHAVVGFDLSEDACDQLRQLGAEISPDVGSVAAQSSVVFVMVPSRRVGEIFEGEDGAIARSNQGTILVEGGNSDPRESVRLAELAEAQGVNLLDVGFSGGPRGAAAGELAVMVGGSKESYHRVESLLGVLGKHVDYFGPSGSGHLSKALNHLVQGLTAQAIGEAVAIAESTDLDTQKWVRAVSHGAAGSWLMDRMREMQEADPPKQEDVDAWWAGHGARNQLSYALEAAEAAEVPVPLAATGHQVRVLSLSADRSVAMEIYVRLTWALAHLNEEQK